MNKGTRTLRCNLKFVLVFLLKFYTTKYSTLMNKCFNLIFNYPLRSCYSSIIKNYIIVLYNTWQLYYEASFIEFLKMNSKMKSGDQLIYIQNNLKNLGIYNLNNVIISCVLRILASQNELQLYDKIFNIDRLIATPLLV